MKLYWKLKAAMTKRKRTHYLVINKKRFNSKPYDYGSTYETTKWGIGYWKDKDLWSLIEKASADVYNNCEGWDTIET